MIRGARIFISLSLLSLVLAGVPAEAQSLGGPGIAGPSNDQLTNTRGGTAPFDVSPSGLTQLNSRMLTWGDQQLSPLQNPHLMSSKLDAKAPAKARQEFEKGYSFLYGKDYQHAIEHLTASVEIYPEFVAAHQALGSAYLAEGKNEEARDEFAQAVVLDNRIPASYFNLGRAELELKHYGSAELAEQKAAAIAPLDVKVLSTLAQAQLMNRDFPGAIATAGQIHSSKGNPPHAMVHFYAAAAWEAQDEREKARLELQTLLKEDSKSDAASQARDVLRNIDSKDVAGASLLPTSAADHGAIASQLAAQAELQKKLAKESEKQEQQITEAEAICETCEQAPVTPASGSAAPVPAKKEGGWTLHSDVNEVNVFFVATDHGKPVRTLSQTEVTVRDDGKAPASIVAFRTEDQIPLRLGLIIDASSSVTKRFTFEQASASEFVKKILVGNDDQGFVVSVSNSVLMLQDFTPDGAELSSAVNSMAPAGGTALWDAVAFGADKLAARRETQPVARVLVVISDGQNNSSKTSLKQAIETAERDGVSVYTISTSDARYVSTALLEATILGNRALRALSDHTGGSSFAPGSVRSLDHSLSELEEFIHSRYLVAYKPALLERADRYRTIDIGAAKDGHKLRVYARKGYYVHSSDFAD
jgi:VWFA-related protein